jgi:hypothetical protein
MVDTDGRLESRNKLCYTTLLLYALNCCRHNPTTRNVIAEDGAALKIAGVNPLYNANIPSVCVILHATPIKDKEDGRAGIFDTMYLSLLGPWTCIRFLFEIRSRNYLITSNGITMALDIDPAAPPATISTTRSFSSPNLDNNLSFIIVCEEKIIPVYGRT